MLTCDLCTQRIGGLSDLDHHMKTHLYNDVHEKTNRTLPFLQPHKPAENKNSMFRCDLCNFRVRQFLYLQSHILKHVENEADTQEICAICKLKFRTIYQLKKHLRLHYKLKNYFCPICDEQFTTITEVKRHKVIHQTPDSRVKKVRSTVQCSQCREMFYSESQLQLHRCTSVKADRLRCTVCNKTFATMYRLRQHTNIHTGERPYVCNVCGRGFLDYATLADHKYLHSDEKSFVCEKCGARFKQKTGLKSHMKSHLAEELRNKGTDSIAMTNRFQCKICGWIVARLDTHMRSHTGERPFRCETCGQSFTQSGTLKNHMRLHSNTTYTCKFCKKDFKHPISFRIHERSHTREKLCKCKICGKEYTCQSSLNIHMKKHTLGKQACHICGKELEVSSLRAHLETHGTRRFVCGTCNKGFKTQNCLKRHLVIHCDNRPFVCGYPGCNTSFPFKHDLVKHTKQHISEPS